MTYRVKRLEHNLDLCIQDFCGHSEIYLSPFFGTAHKLSCGAAHLERNGKTTIYIILCVSFHGAREIKPQMRSARIARYVRDKAPMSLQLTPSMMRCDGEQIAIDEGAVCQHRYVDHSSGWREQRQQHLGEQCPD